MKLEQDFFVGVQDVDMNKELTNQALVEMMSDVSMLHGVVAGHTSAHGKSTISWILLGWKVRVYERPSMFSRLRVYTWVQDYGLIRGNRDYAVYDEDDNLVAKATAEWTPIDVATGKFIKITPEVIGVFDPEMGDSNFPGYKLPAMRRFEMEPDAAMEIDLNRGMFDYNRHVHNSIYVTLAEEILPNDVLASGLDDIEIVYKLEITVGQSKALLEYKQEDGKHIVAVRNPEDRKIHAVVTFAKSKE